MTVHRKKEFEKTLPAKPAEHAAKPKKLVKPHAQKLGAGYELAPKGRANIGIGLKRSHATEPISAGSSEVYLMQGALGRLEKALGAYENQVKALESDPMLYLADRELLKPLTNALREVQGQLNSCTHHAETWFKDQPAELSGAKTKLQEYNTRFEALTVRANKAGSTQLSLHPQVEPRY